MSQVEVTPISSRLLLGEGPHWIEKDQTLVYVDLFAGNIHRYFTDTKRQQNLHVEGTGTGGTASFVIPVKDHEHEFVLGLGRTVASVKWTPEESDNIVKKPKPFVTIDQHDTSTRFNDAKCDPAGRLWAGTMHDEADPFKLLHHRGSLYKFDSNLKPSSMEQAISISNGLAWSADCRTFYFVDSLEYRVDAYDYDHSRGHISKRREVFDLRRCSDTHGFPDGMAIDANGHLWVANYKGSQVSCIDPTVGKLLRNVTIPASLITSCCWGGPDYMTLFVTSGSINVSPKELNVYPDAGKTFAVTGLGVKGLPAPEFKVNEEYWVK